MLEPALEPGHLNVTRDPGQVPVTHPVPDGHVIKVSIRNTDLQLPYKPLTIA